MTTNPPADHAPMPSTDPLDRSAIRKAFRQEEEACVKERLRQTEVFSRDHGHIHAYAVDLIKDARKREVGGIDAFLHQLIAASAELNPGVLLRKSADQGLRALV